MEKKNLEEEGRKRFKNLAEKKYKELERKSGQKIGGGETELTCYGDLLFYLRKEQYGQTNNEYEYEVTTNVEKLDLLYFLQNEKEYIKDLEPKNLSIIFKRDARHFDADFIKEISEYSFIKNAKIRMKLLGGYCGRPVIGAYKYEELKLNLFENIDTLYFDAGFDLKFLGQKLDTIKNVSNLYLYTAELKLKNETDLKKLKDILKEYASKNSKTKIFSNENKKQEYKEVCTMPKKKKLLPNSNCNLNKPLEYKPLEYKPLEYKPLEYNLI